MVIKQKVEVPETGLYDLIFTKEGFIKGGRHDKCQVCQDNEKNRAYYEKHGTWSPFLTTVGKCTCN